MLQSTLQQLTSSDFSVSTGLIHPGYWGNITWYFVNVERGDSADKLQPRNINVSFQNNSNVPTDLIVFRFFSDELVLDIETGIVTKYFFKKSIILSSYTMILGIGLFCFLIGLSCFLIGLVT